MLFSGEELVLSDLQEITYIPARRAGFEELAYALFEATAADQLLVYRGSLPGEMFDPALALGALSLQEKQFFWSSQLDLSEPGDFQQSPAAEALFPAFRSHTWAVYPLANRQEEILGAVLTGWLTEKENSAGLQVEVLLRAMALELDNSRLYEQTYQQQLQASIAQQTTQAILRRKALPEILAFIAQEGMHALDALGCSIWLFQDDGRLAEVVDTGRPASSPLGSADERILQASEPFIVYPESEPFNEAERGRLLIIPLMNNQKAVGYFQLYQIEAYAQQKDLNTARFFANQAAVAVELDSLYQRMQKAAAAEERARLARDLHDSICQSLYALTLYSHAARRQLKEGDLASAEAHIQSLDSTSREALGDMRLLIFQLRPQMLKLQGLKQVLEQRLQMVESRSGLAVELDYQLPDELPAEVEENLYHIALEALNNVIKHACANRVWVSLSPAGDCAAVLSIRDDGCGFDPQSRAQGGLGLKSICERVEALRGRVEITAQPGEGASIIVEVPYE